MKRPTTSGIRHGGFCGTQTITYKRPTLIRSDDPKVSGPPRPHTADR